MSESVSTSLRDGVAVLLSVDRLAPFVSSGFVGAGVDVLALYALVEFVELGPVLAKTLTWELTVAVIFVLNERWAFAGAGENSARGLLGRFVRSNLVRFGGFLVTLGALAVLVEAFHVWYVVANVLAIWVGFVVNYVCECFVTWKIHR